MGMGTPDSYSFYIYLDGPSSGATWCLLSDFDIRHRSDLRSGRYNEGRSNVPHELRYVNPVKCSFLCFFSTGPVIIGFLFSGRTGCVLYTLIIIGLFWADFCRFVCFVFCVSVGLPTPCVYLLPCGGPLPLSVRRHGG